MIPVKLLRKGYGIQMTVPGNLRAVTGILREFLAIGNDSSKFES